MASVVLRLHYELLGKLNRNNIFQHCFYSNITEKRLLPCWPELWSSKLSAVSRLFFHSFLWATSHFVCGGTVCYCWLAFSHWSSMVGDRQPMNASLVRYHFKRVMHKHFHFEICWPLCLCFRPLRVFLSRHQQNRQGRLCWRRHL